MRQAQFNNAELQVIERMAMAFECAMTHDWDNYQIESQRTIALISNKENPAEFIMKIREKAGSYVDRYSPGCKYVEESDEN